MTFPQPNEAPRANAGGAPRWHIRAHRSVRALSVSIRGSCLNQLGLILIRPPIRQNLPTPEQLKHRVPTDCSRLPGTNNCLQIRTRHPRNPKILIQLHRHLSFGKSDPGRNIQKVSRHVKAACGCNSQATPARRTSSSPRSESSRLELYRRLTWVRSVRNQNCL
jgi:hypothetical protein